MGMKEKNHISQFEQVVMPHLDAAYNLARWLTRNDHDAEDLVQMAFVRAVKFFDGYQGGNARAWLLTIVRNTFYTSLRDKQHENNDVNFDEGEHSHADVSVSGTSNNPETLVTSQDTSRIVMLALENLPNNFREIVILKEIEELSYKEIANIAGVPIGTVMSRLARGRKMLVDYLQKVGIGGAHGM
jgi:RNA polymerase sigma-70 factor (ECF subfamily)